MVTAQVTTLSILLSRLDRQPRPRGLGTRHITDSAVVPLCHILQSVLHSLSFSFSP